MLHTLLIALAIIGSLAAIITLLIMMAKRQGRHRNKQLQDAYLAQLAQHNLNPEFSQVFDHRILALDTVRGVFVFVQQNEAQPFAVINLSDISDCKLWKDGVQISRKRGNRPEAVEEYISAVGLSFTRKSGVATNIPIYTEVLDGIEQKITLHKAAEQWVERITRALSAREMQVLKSAV
jgi:hypothetical protein